MGLAGPRKYAPPPASTAPFRNRQANLPCRRRTKLSHDPNNTAWTRSDSSYGRRQLLAQGWQPGKLLGRADAAHAQHLTAASASHIRVTLYDENAGLGVKLGRDEGECTGLDGLQDLLGRLNAKGEEALSREKEVREKLKRGRMVAERYGRKWVSGGFLEGAEVKVVGATPANGGGEGKAVTPDVLSAMEVQSEERSAAEEKKRRKRLARLVDASLPERSQQGNSETTIATSDDVLAQGVNALLPNESRKAHKTKKRRKREEHRPELREAETLPAAPNDLDSQTEGFGAVAGTDAADPSETVVPVDKGRDREDGARKKRKKTKKGKPSRHSEPEVPDMVAQTRELPTDLNVAPTALQDSVTRPAEEDKVPERPPFGPPMSKPSPNPSELWAGGRNAVRRRYIQHKKMALDPKALNEVSSYAKPMLPEHGPFTDTRLPTRFSWSKPRPVVIFTCRLG